MSGISACAANCGRARQKGRPLCRVCFYELPEDLQERIRWAAENGTALDKAATTRAVLEYCGAG